MASRRNRKRWRQAAPPGAEEARAGGGRRGDRDTSPNWGAGGPTADWGCASLKNLQLIRQAIRRGWPTRHGEAILRQVMAGLDGADAWRGLALARVALAADRHRLVEDQAVATL